MGATLTAGQRQFFATGETRSRAFRQTQLSRLKAAILDYQAEILAALRADLRKPDFETYATELSVVGDIDYALKHLKGWMRPSRVSVPLTLQPAAGQVRSEPLGVVLIISPWNYPFQLSISPLVSAIAAGNCAILKPSEIAPQTSAALAHLIQSTFPNDFIAVAEGGVETSQALLSESFDHIFFTGGAQIGKRVMQAAAEHLTPVTLELGGKSPCMVTADADIQTAARRIIWGKGINAGQSCIAPDYLLVQQAVKAPLLQAMQQAIVDFFGEDRAQSPDYGRIISDRHFQRLCQLMEGDIVAGGQADAAERYIDLTLIDASPEAAVMQEEIFGPILPVLSYEQLTDAIAFVNTRPKPLALYCFTTNAAEQERVLNETTSGSLCFNETMSQYAVPDFPFGGVGASGMGRAHGKAGFDTFSYTRSVLKKPNWLDLPLRYPPYKNKLSLLKKLLK
ncbi:aldehyde dehydrogenase family protein [Romeria aff. gracilis LEGE 07310]|uniref:Aldehyde dehydrogenase n=1 Tax=Vasconcelosia minhoensis LEGE 07310 TaxID=915328 RepID=A0A8J7DRW6_9CYAN|nr:aldehyde dehydrogenase family protein [Romeria gracilis]MBE9079444.1 aldehyde dehydrogenase family protein [Romeria aff. gracilis LEGE 07310]